MNTAAQTQPDNLHGALMLEPSAVSPDGRFLIFTDGRGRLLQIDAATGRVVRRLPPPDGRSIAGSPFGSGWHEVAGFADDGNAVYVSFFDENSGVTSLIRWDLRTGASAEVTRYIPESQMATDVLEADRRFVIVPGTNGALVAVSPFYSGSSTYGQSSEVVIRNETAAGRADRSIKGGFWGGSAPHFTKDGSRFFRKLWQAEWSEWDTESGAMLASGKGPDFGGTLTDTIAFDAERERLFVGSTKKFAVMKRSGNGWRAVATLNLPNGQLPGEGFGASPDGRWFAVTVFGGGAGEKLLLYDLSKIAE